MIINFLIIIKEIMKIYLDKKFLQDISRGKQKLLISDEQKEEVERIEGMINQDIRFCGLVTGYRGTGKSSFIHYILKKYIDEKCEDKNKKSKRNIVITYNAAKYKNYETFLRRFVRELYYQMKEKDSVSEQLGKMYFQTFFDIKEFYENGHLKIDINSKEKEKTLTCKKNINVGAVVENICKMFMFLAPIVVAWKNVNKAILLVVWMISTIGTYIALSLEKKWLNKSVEKHNIQSLDEQREVAETFYDEEISEYYIFEELETINKKINLIFVLDELDKVKNEELDAIFNDLKPLFLSCNCNFILIAGRNMDKYLYESQKNIDSIAKSIFTNRIYIPLSTIQDMMDFAECFLAEENLGGKRKKFYSNENIEYYFKQKIFISRGVKRTFINNILSDLKWDNNNLPYIEVSDDNISEESKILFDILGKMEEIICQEYTGPKRDELLQNVYHWMEKIKENRHRVFRKKDIIGDEEEIIKNSIYSNVAEKTNLLYAFFRCMIDKKMLQEDENETYRWKDDIAIKEIENQGEKEKIINERNLEYADMFQKQWDEINNIIYRFAEYNGKIEKGSSIDLGVNNRFLNEMLGEVDQLMNTYEKRNLSDLQSLYENINVEEVKTYSRNMSVQKGILVEKLMAFTVAHKCQNGIVKPERDNKSFYQRFDIVFQKTKSNRIVFFEIKYYKEYAKMIHSSLILKLRGMIEKYIVQYNIKEYKLKLVVFTNSVDESGLNKFNDKVKKMLNSLDETTCIDVILVPFNTFNKFRKQLDEVLEKE